MLALGDIAERGLRFLGITKERVSAVAGKDCGCKKRQQAMNDAGYRWQYALQRPYYLLRSRSYAACYRIRLASHFAWMAVRVLIYGR